VSIRRACRVLPFDTSSYHYQSRRTDPAFLKKRIKDICETHVRYGYRRVYQILRRECGEMRGLEIHLAFGL
jgi:putative transposase